MHLVLPLSSEGLYNAPLMTDRCSISLLKLHCDNYRCFLGPLNFAHFAAFSSHPNQYFKLNLSIIIIFFIKSTVELVILTTD